MSPVRSFIKWLVVIAVAALLTLATPLVVSMFDRALVHQGRHMPERRFVVCDAAGTAVGHGYAYWAYATVNLGQMQVLDPHRATGRLPRSVPPWADVNVPPPFTAVTLMASGWPAPWRVSRTFIDHNNAAAMVSDGPTATLWLPLFANVVFFVVLLLIVGQLLELARRIRAWLRVGRNTCPNCRYDLTSLQGTRCPECGHATDRPASVSSAG